MKSEKLSIVGASGHGKVVAEIAQALGYAEIHFYDDRAWELEARFPYPVKGTVAQLFEQTDWRGSVFVAIGKNAIRKQLYTKLARAGFRFATLIHPAAIISVSASIGKGTVAMPGVIVNASTVIGVGCILNTGCTVDHDCTLGDFVHISPGTHLAGNVIVGGESWLGIGSSVIQGVSIAERTQTGANTAVVSDIETGGLYVGSPAKRIK